ncbi:alanine racemase [Fructilactobacillus myrtifloralis]|uniref:Alanine racemase n=1 Tax=Fructilactobacillus myrtifloralis TaxID=2940301 RepID=A0ABY5BQL5_9LACO|nr:alanine racemase [Fructilactobacillus myrtifloralis]USS84881.1 alanine racemase [Fructilactobacillus myrtifloralis]
MVIGKNRNGQILINETAIRHNVQQAVDRLPRGTELFAVVKADGYGHGAVVAARLAKQAGATGFCVAILDEAIQLREAGFVTEPILVLGLTDVAQLALIAKYQITVTVADVAWLHDAQRVKQALGLTTPIKFFLALDSGMGRIGLQTPAEVDTFVRDYATLHPDFEWQGVYTHFATADSPDQEYFDFQVANFRELLAQFPHRPRYVSVANSATDLWHSIPEANLVRYGVAMYGLNPAGTALTPPFPLVPALSLTSELVYVKQVQSGRSIGYGATYQVDTPQWIGTVPMGYADGLRRDLQGFFVLINGQRCPIVGRVCMDQLMVKLPKHLPVGTKVTIIGSDQEQTISLQEMAEYCHTIHYELACGFSTRVPRLYYAGDAQTKGLR